MASKALFIAVSLLLLTAGAASAHAPRQRITLVNRAGVDSATLRSVEHVLTLQAAQLRRYWHTPLIRFEPHGWRLVLEHYDSSIPGVEGHHFAGPSALVTSYGDAPWTVALSHELLEMLVDPRVDGQEVCDPVADVSYVLAGVPVADFVTQAWNGSTSGPWDLESVLLAPDTTSANGYIYPEASAIGLM